MDVMTMTPGTGRDARAPLRAAGRLLQLAKTRESLARKRNPFPPFIHLLVNIFFCSFAQRYLADDAGGVYLPLFIVVQCSLGILITMSFIGRTGSEILSRTRLFPGLSSAGYYFLLAGSVRRPEFYLFSAVGCMFPAIVHSPGLLSSAGIVAISTLPVLTSQVLCCAAAVRLIRASRPVTGLFLFTIAGAVIVIASVFVFSAGVLASSLPMVGWAAAGITAFARGQTGTGWAYVLSLGLTTAAILAIFRK